MPALKPGRRKGAHGIFSALSNRPCITEDGRSTAFDGDEKDQGGSMPIMNARPAGPVAKAKGSGSFF